MKSFLSYLTLLMIILPGCRKDDNPRIPDIIEVPLPFFQKDETTSLTISAQDPTTFSAKFSVDNFFKAGTPPKEMDIVIIRRSEEHTSELQSPCNLVCRLLLEKKKKNL